MLMEMKTETHHCLAGYLKATQTGDIDSLPSQENLPYQANILPSQNTQSNQNGISTSTGLTRAQESSCKGG